MSGGAYAALSGMQSRLEALDRIASDLANVGTAGYKSERTATFAAERDAFAAALEAAVDVTRGGTKTDFRPGMIASTGRDLDAAIDGPAFFMIETPQGTRYTRNGSFSRRNDGLLVTSDGEPVLGVAGPDKTTRITLPKGAPVTIQGDGSLQSDGTTIAQLKLVEFDPKDMIRESGSRFRAVAGAQPKVSQATVVSGSLEQANVSVVDRMVSLTELTRTFESLQRGVSVLMNELDGRAIVELGRRV